LTFANSVDPDGLVAIGVLIHNFGELNITHVQLTVFNVSDLPRSSCYSRGMI